MLYLDSFMPDRTLTAQDFVTQFEINTDGLGNISQIKLHLISEFNSWFSVTSILNVLQKNCEPTGLNNIAGSITRHYRVEIQKA